MPCDLGAVPVVTATPCICSPNAAGAIASRAAPVRGGRCQLQGNTTETSGLVAISSAPIFPLLTADICEYQKAVPGWGTAGGVSSPWHLKAAWQLLLRTRMGTRGRVTGAVPLARAQDPSFSFSCFYSVILRVKGHL